MGDRDRLSRIEAEQDRAVGEYFRYQLYPYSAFHRKRLDTAGIGATGVRSRADLSRVPMITLAEIDDPAAVVLRPDPATVVSGGTRGFALAMRWATLTGQLGKAARRRIDPLYKPIHWTIAPSANGTGPGLIVGSTAADLERLGELGRRWLEQAGIRALDVLVSILPAGPNLAFWQLQLGARRGGVSTLLLEPDADPDVIATAQPTALAGRSSDVLRVLESLPEPARAQLRTVITAGDLLDDVIRSRLTKLAPEAFVVAAWAPPGTRALWSECRGGTGFHTWPHAEVVEIVDGEIVWSALGWRGTALVRLRTGVQAQIDSRQCPTCGRTTPRLLVEPPRAAPARGRKRTKGPAPSARH